MKNFFHIEIAAIAGPALGIILFAWFVENAHTYNLGREVAKVMKECESKLPRNENCVIIAVPENVKGE